MNNNCLATNNSLATRVAHILVKRNNNGREYMVRSAYEYAMYCSYTWQRMCCQESWAYRRQSNKLATTLLCTTDTKDIII